MAVVVAPPSKNTPSALVTAVALAIARPQLVEGPEGVHDVVEAHGRPAGSAVTKRWSGIHRARVRRPRGQNSSLFIQREIRVGDDLGGMCEGFRWVEEVVEIEFKRSVARRTIGRVHDPFPLRRCVPAALVHRGLIEDVILSSRLAWAARRPHRSQSCAAS